MQPSVLVVGGGLAGLAACTGLAARGLRVRLVEARPRLGGRASSFQDAASGQMIDACQHVTMGCCTNFAHFCRTLGVERLLEPQAQLYFMTPDRRVSVLQADPLPAPLHLARSFLKAHYLTLAEKLRVGAALLALQQASDREDPPFMSWLVRQGQTPRMIARFWGIVLVSALNEDVERVGLRYARKVFVDGMLRHPRGFQVYLPGVPLGRLYGQELQAWLQRHGVEVRLGQAARTLHLAEQRVQCVELRDGERLQADHVVLALPFDRVLDVLPPATVEAHREFANLRQLEVAPITSVHCWFDRAATAMPHVVLLDSVGQWVFNRGEAHREHYLQVVVSASRQFRGWGHEQVQRQVVAELRERFPALASAELRRCRVITEHAATFSATPGVDRWRPAQRTSIGNLSLAGDWTATGWPATMEGAVRSGYLAAEAVLRHCGKAETLVQPDLD